MTFEEFLARAEKAGIIDFRMRIVRNPDGLLDFYIHPQDRDGDTGDFHVSGGFVTKLEVGAGSARNAVAPIIGS